MGLANYKVVFRGEITPGHEPRKVKQDIAQLFKLDAKKIEKIFSGSKVTLKKDLNYEQARESKDKLNSMGLIVYLEEEAEEFTVAANMSKDSREISQEYKAPKVREDTHFKRKYLKIFALAPSFVGLDFSGRFGRLNFVNAYVGLLLLVVLCIAIMIYIPINSMHFPIAVCFVYVIFTIRLVVLRLHDFDMNGWWSLIIFIPGLNLIFLLVLLFTPGNKSGNEYGPIPIRGSFLGLIVLIIFPVLIGFFSASMMPRYNAYITTIKVFLIHKDMSRYSNLVDIALEEGKIPVIGTETTNPNKYYPIGMAKGNITKSSSDQSLIEGVTVVGLVKENNNKNIKIYAKFDDEFADLSGVTISLEKVHNYDWACYFKADKQANFQASYLPEDCRIKN